MRKTNITFNEQATEKLLAGVDKICNAVKQTLGAGGRVVIMEDGNGNPLVTKDGVTVASFIDLVDPVENMACQLIKQVAGKTVLSAGDGTTTSCVLAQAIIRKGMEEIKAGKSPVTVSNEIKAATKKAIENIRTQSISIKGDWAKVKQVALISTNGDEEHSELLIEAMKQIGDDGVLMVRETRDKKSSVNVVHGLEFNEGYLSPFFINNNKNECVFEDPIICVTTETLSYLKDQIWVAMEYAMNAQRPLVFICNNSDGEAFAAMIKNRNTQGFPICAINIPDRNLGHEGAIDIATATGAKVLGSEFGTEVKDSTPESYGTCEKIVVSVDKTLIIGGKGEKTDIDNRIASIKAAIESAESEEEEGYLKGRLAKLSGGVALMKVGGISEAAVRELKDRCDDAMHATRCALEEGIVPGGGVAYLNARNNETNIINDPLYAPYKQILLNAGIVKDAAIESALDPQRRGINVRTGEVVDMVGVGIIDATKVVCAALENASDVASLLLTSNTVITNIGAPVPQRRKA